MTQRLFLFTLFLAIWTVSIQSLFAAEFSLKLDTSSLVRERISAEQLSSVQAFLADTQMLLPPRLRAQIGKEIKVKFEKIGNGELSLPRCEGQEVKQETKEIYGSQSGDQIVLNLGFLPEILSGPEHSRQFSCKHKNLFNLARATLIHEAAHLYDFSDWNLLKELRNEFGYGLVSSDPYYQKVANWSHHRTFSHLLTSHLSPNNYYWGSSIDSYEYKDIAEHFAVNMEYFILDPKYGCERPIEKEFLVKHFGFDPFPEPECKVNTIAYFNFLNSSNHIGVPVDLNPERIYEVHSLLSSGGHKWGDHWGHIMLRFVICKEGRELGPNCRQDIKNHVVIDFRFEKDGGAGQDWWSAVTGKFVSRPFLYSFSEVIDEYNDKFRDLESLPIQLTTDEKRRLVYRFLELYWGYRGRYYFLSNNCAQEAARLLKVAVQRKDLLEFKPLTPVGFHEGLVELGLAHKEVLEDRNEAIQQGYFFPSARLTLEKAYNLIRNSNVKLGFRWKHLEDYLSHSLPEERREVFMQVYEWVNQNTLDRKFIREIYAAFYCLEDSIYSYLQRNLEKKAYNLLVKRAQGNSDPEAVRALGLVKAEEAALPGNIPSRLGMVNGADHLTLEDKRDAHTEKIEPVKAWIQKNFSSRIAVIQSIQENISLFKGALRDSIQIEKRINPRASI